jgi:hypothetical protein
MADRLAASEWPKSCPDSIGGMPWSETSVAGGTGQAQRVHRRATRPTVVQVDQAAAYCRSGPWRWPIVDGR